MSEHIQRTALLLCTVCLFCTTVIGGLFLSNAASLWLRNRREERRARAAEKEIRANAWAENEREQWFALLARKDAELQALQNELLRVSKNCEIASRLLRESEKQRLDKEAA